MNPPVAQFIKSCARAALDDAHLDTVNAELDWELVLEIALRHGMMPLVYRALSPAWTTQLPASAYQRLERESRGHALRSLHLANELVRVCRMLERKGVRALALKGPALAASIYGDVRLRQFTDLDVLVREGDLTVALAVFGADGYRPAMPQTSEAAAAIGVPGAHEMTLIKSKSLFTIDLHWRLSPPYFSLTPEGEELWERAVETELAAGRISTLGPEDLMLYLCAHGAKHGWQSLGGVCDVAMVASRCHYNWEALVARAAMHGGLRALLLGAQLAHESLCAPIPEELLAMANAEPGVRRAARIFFRYFDRLDGYGPRLLQRWLIPLRTLSDGSARARYAFARALFPGDADWQFVRLPEGLFPLYYALRPLRLAWQKGLKRAA